MYRIFIFEMFLELLCTNSERICHGLHSPDWSSKNSKKAAKWQIWIGKLAGALGHCFLKTLRKPFLYSFVHYPATHVLSRAQPFVTPWTVAHQAPLFMEFSRQEYSGLPFPPPGELTDPETEPVSPALAGGFFTIVPHLYN